MPISKKVFPWLLRLCLIVVCCVIGLMSLSVKGSKAHTRSMSVLAGTTLGNDVANSAPALSPSPDVQRLYMGWTGPDKHVHIRWMDSSDNDHFNDAKKVTLNDTATSAPAMATFNNNLYVAYVGTNSYGNIGLGIYTPGANSLQKFSVLHITSGLAMTNKTPAMVSANGVLYIAWLQGIYNYNTGPIYTLHISTSSQSDPSATFADHVLDSPLTPPLNVDSAVSLAVSGGTIHVTYIYNNLTTISNQIYEGIYSLSNPRTLSPLNPLPQWTTEAPAIMANGTGVLWIAYQGTDSTDTLCMTESTGLYTGCVPEQIGNVDPGRSPALGSSFSGKKFIAWLDMSQHIVYSRFV